MRAVGFSTFGGPEVLEVVDVPVADPGPGEVRIRVAFAAVNPTDLSTRDGSVAERYRPFPPPWVVGMDASGTIESVGEGVERFRVGDRVMAAVSARRPERGAQCELLLAPAASVVAVPQELSLQQAATLPMNGLTALQALDLLAIPAGGTLVVTGGAGVLGAATIVLATRRGLRVIADARAGELELVSGWGAEVVERGEGFVDRVRAVLPAGADGLLDGGLLGPASYGAIRDGGGYAAVRGFRGDPPERGITPHEVWVVERLADTAGLELVGELAAAGELPLRIAGEFPPEEAAEAHRRMAAGGVRGRFLIRF